MRSKRPHVLPFPTPTDTAGSPPTRPPLGVVATMSIDATEVARLIARNVADGWVAPLNDERHRESGTGATDHCPQCGALRRHDPPRTSNVFPFPRPAASPPPSRLPTEGAATGPISAADMSRLIGRDESRAARPRRQLVPTVVLSVRPHDGCRRRIALPTFRALLGEPTWSLVTQFLVTGRWYAEGLDLALALLACADGHRGRMSAGDEAHARIALYTLVLDMLDRLDAWDTYLDVWQQLRQHTAYTVRHGRAAATDPRAQPYVVGRQGDRTDLHFLWYTDHRARLIARKVAKHRAGGPVGHLRHHPQSALSATELQRRLAWVARSGHMRRWQDTEPAPAADEEVRGEPADPHRPASERCARPDRPPVLSLLLAD